MEEDRVRNAWRADIEQSLLAPVQSVLAYTEFLSEHFDDSGEEQAIADLKKIADAGVELLEQARTFASFTAETPQSDLAIYRHDLRNVLGVISGYAEMLIEDAEDHWDESIPRYLELIRQETLQLIRFLNELRDDEGSLPGTQLVEQIFSSLQRGINRSQDGKLKGRILVVDDNESSRHLLCHQLRRFGHTAYEASNGRRGLDLMRELHPDVVLLDLLMPEMNGYEVLQEVRDDASLRNIRVVMVSGINDQDGAIRCIDAGASDYLNKPVNATLLQARVSALIERRMWEQREREYLTELERSRDFIRKVFGRYLSEDIVDRLLDNADGLDLGGKGQKVTIMMTDIRGFSTLSRQLPPQQCMALLNNFLGRMTDVIMSFGGTVDEFIGDAILAIWGAPVPQDNDCDRAVACAVAMQKAMAEVNAWNLEHDLPEIACGIGINTGEVIVGNIGSEKRSKYGIVGHHVNMAGRVEKCTVGGQVLISEYTLADMQMSPVIRNSTPVSVKGMSRALMIHEIGGVGEPYNLHLDEQAEELISVADGGWGLDILSASGATDGFESHRAQVSAFSPRKLQLTTHYPLTVMDDVRLHFDETPEESEYAYAKVTRVLSNGIAELTITALTDAAEQAIAQRYQERTS